MKFRKKVPFAAVAFLAILAGLLPSVSDAGLDAVSGRQNGNPPVLTDARNPGSPVSYSLANGFPLWYRDANGLKLELCLDNTAALDNGSVITPCLLTANIFNPISFPNNFGIENFYWLAQAFGTYNSRLDNGALAPGFALFVGGLEAAFSRDLGVIDGDQMVFGRIRLRIDVPVAGTYRVVHPFGQFDYQVTVTGLRSINQTSDIGNFLSPGPPPAGDFTVPLFDGTGPIIPVPFNPTINAGVVNADNATVGPFLRPNQPDVVASNGRRYIANPGTDLNPLFVPVVNGPFGNALTVTLLDPPPNFFLNAANNSQVLVFSDFQVSGKIFNEGPNLPPTAVPDAAATARDKPVRIDVAANDLDPVGGGNVHDINPQALGLPAGQGPTLDLTQGIRISLPLTTAQGGTVRRFTTLSTGKTVFVYTPPAGFVGRDSFFYVVQDTGGLVSQPALVDVLVEDLVVERAAYRARAGKWSISGTTSEAAANSVTLTLGPRAFISGAAEVPAVASGARGDISMRVTDDSITYRLVVGPMPSSEVTAARIHVGAPGENGPAIFNLYNRAVEPIFTGRKTASLTQANLVPQAAAGVRTYDEAVGAILEGRTYVKVHTAANPAGEIRGQILAHPVAVAEVAPDGKWSFEGKFSTAGPGGDLRALQAVSGKGTRLLNVPLRVR